jgi:hypothetical protein
MGGDHSKQAMGFCDHACGPGNGIGTGEGLHRLGGLCRVAGGGGEPAQAKGTGPQRSNVPICESQQHVGDPESLVEGAHGLVGTVQIEHGQPFQQPNPRLLNPDYGVPADQRSTFGRQAVHDREAALALGVRVAVHDSRQNDPNPVTWQPGQDYRIAEAIQAARAQPVRTRWGPERTGPER